MASAVTPMNIEEENAFIASLEQTIEDMEYKRASNDIENYMSVSQSLEGLLGNEKTVNHLKDFVVDERCEENVLFLLDVKEYKKMYSDNNYQTNQVSLHSYCNQSVRLFSFYRVLWITHCGQGSDNQQAVDGQRES